MREDVDRNDRFEVLAQGEADPLLTLAEEVLATAAVDVVLAPRVGMLMLRLREPVQSAVYNAGEVVVTEARVACGEGQGYAMRLGWQPEATLAAAVLDAAVEAGHPLRERILALLAALRAAEAARQAAAWREVAPTRVAFEEMRP